jgi:hypothetical protein
MLLLPNEPADARAPVLAYIVAVVLAAAFVGSMWLHGCSPDADPPVVHDCTAIKHERDDALLALEVPAAEHESQVIEAELRGYERCMYGEPISEPQGKRGRVFAVERSALGTAAADVAKANLASQKWPPVLSVFTSADPSKPDKLAGSSSAWPLPPGPVTLESMVAPGARSVPDNWARRRVRADDFGVAMRNVRRYTRVEICQPAEPGTQCVVAPVITTGPWGALCRDRRDCANDAKCERQVGDITRPGDKTVYHYTHQIPDGPCEYRGAVDVTPAVQAAGKFVPMRPVTVARL